MSRVPPAMAVLLALSRRAPGASVGGTFESEWDAADPAFQSSVLALAQYHGQLGVALLWLERSGRFAAMPPGKAVESARALGLLRRQAALWDMERNAVAERLRAAGIPALFLKGAALRLTAYGDSTERPFSDIDVLLPRRALDDAVRALAERGYEPEAPERARLYLEHHHHLILRKQSGFVVELHWGLQPVRSPFALDPEAFQRDARLVPAADESMLRVPSAEHMLLHVAAQSMEDGFARLRRLVDADRVISTARPLDWGHLAAEARRMGVGPVLALSLRLCELLLGTTVEPEFIERLGVSAVSRAHLALLDPVGLVVERAQLPRAAVHNLLLLWCIPDTRVRLRVLRDMLSGRHDWLWRQLGPERVAGGWWRPATAVSKLAAYQLLLYPAAALGRMRGGPHVPSFWAPVWHGG